MALFGIGLTSAESTAVPVNKWLTFSMKKNYKLKEVSMGRISPENSNQERKYPKVFIPINKTVLSQHLFVIQTNLRECMGMDPI